MKITERKHQSVSLEIKMDKFWKPSGLVRLIVLP